MLASVCIFLHVCFCFVFFFFFNDTATTEIYTLSLHDALPISPRAPSPCSPTDPGGETGRRDRKSTRLNSSHANISYAVFCLKKKKKIDTICKEKTKTKNKKNTKIITI